MDPFLAQAQAAGESPMQRAIRILSVYFPQLQQTLGQDFYAQHGLPWGPLPQMQQPPAPPPLQRPTREQAQSILRGRGLLRDFRPLTPEPPPSYVPHQPSYTYTTGDVHATGDPRPPAVTQPVTGDPRPPALMGPPVQQDDLRRRQQQMG